MDQGSETHRRRSIRLPCHDYSLSGAYFVTICSYRKQCTFDDETVRGIIERSWQGLPEGFTGLQLGEFVIMPNHVHFVVWLLSDKNVAAGRGRPRHQGAASSAPTLGEVVRALKSIAAIGVNRHFSRSGMPVWQRNYFERVVRNQRELNAIRRYIEYNPMTWDRDCENPERAHIGGRRRTIRDEVGAVLEQAK